MTIRFVYKLYILLFVSLSEFSTSIFPQRELWRREAAVDQTIQNARDELTKCERNLRGTVGKVRGILQIPPPPDILFLYCSLLFSQFPWRCTALPCYPCTSTGDSVSFGFYPFRPLLYMSVYYIYPVRMRSRG